MEEEVDIDVTSINMNQMSISNKRARIDPAIEALEDEARYGDGEDFMDLASKVIGEGDEHLYQKMAEIAATEGNTSIIESIGRVYHLDYDDVAVMARTYGHFDLAYYISGVEVAVAPEDRYDEEDAREDRSLQQEQWTNMGGYSIIKVDSPVEPIDMSPRRKVHGTRRWGSREDDPTFDVTNTNTMWMNSP
jgi:histidinol-phosphate/aromatic aminotransferase/cobyric acid decarboxylase-like protein